MKQTKEDREFSRKFAEALLPHVTRERDQGKSLAEIAAKLGVTAAGLQKQLSGGTPSVRTVAFAYALYKVSVVYLNVDLAKAIASKRKSGRRPVEQQLFLPFEITAPSQSTHLRLKLLSSGVRRYRFRLTVGVAS